jgi:3-deoxy-D-manno-octulosonic-acid transferase
MSKQRSTWLHTVSVGRSKCRAEISQCIAHARTGFALRFDYDDTTGFALARKNAPRWIEVVYTPLDYWPVMRRAFSVIRPVRIVLVEAEIWPNLAAEAHARRIPLALVNARLSARSERRYRQFRFFIAPTFRLLDLVCVPEKEDAKRWVALGVSQDRIRLTGSIKYDPAGLGQVAEIQETAHPVSLNHLEPESPVLWR